MINRQISLCSILEVFLRVSTLVLKLENERFILILLGILLLKSKIHLYCSKYFNISLRCFNPYTDFKNDRRIMLRKCEAES